MQFIVATLSLLVLVFFTGSIIVAVTGALAPEMFTAKQIEPAIKPDAECERILMLGGWGCRYDLRQRRLEKETTGAKLMHVPQSRDPVRGASR